MMGQNIILKYVQMYECRDFVKKVHVGKVQENAQSEKDSTPKTEVGKNQTNNQVLLYHETYRKPNEQLFSQ